MVLCIHHHQKRLELKTNHLLSRIFSPLLKTLLAKYLLWTLLLEGHQALWIKVFLEALRIRHSLAIQNSCS